MAQPDHHGDPDVQHCPSCQSRVVRLTRVMRSTGVWFVCGRCRLSWNITERRMPGPHGYDGVDRRTPLFD
jgi:hypothetical protein